MEMKDAITRRALLRLAGAGCAALGTTAGLESARAAEEYGPFKMGIQSYSLRGFGVDQALEETAKLGLRYWEAFNAHVPLSTEPEKVTGMLEKLKAANVRLVSYGVVGFGADAAANRRVFEGAKALGIATLSADPTPASLDQLEQLVDEFKIDIAIHNHGPGHRYGPLKACLDAVKDRHRRIGVCVDTGHFLRSGENPVQVIEALGSRVLDVHLKDVKDTRRFTILGRGDLDVVGCLKALKALKYRQLLALEYEENPKAPVPDLVECLAAVRRAVQRL
jgi:sugar phosphate isomerase/epimerase